MPPSRPPLLRTVALTLLALLGFTASAQADRVVADQRAYIAPKLNDAGELELGVLRLAYGSTAEQWSPAADTVIHTRPASKGTVPAWTADFDRFPDAFGPVGADVWRSAGDLADGAARGIATLGHTRALLTRRQADGSYLLAPEGSSGTVVGVSGPTGARTSIYTALPDDAEQDPFQTKLLYDSVADPAYDLWTSGSRNVQLTANKWAFRTAGYHCVDFESRAVLADGRRIYDRRAIAVAVGDVDPQAAPVCEVVADSRTTLKVSPGHPVQTGDPVTLAADVSTPGTVSFYDGDELLDTVEASSVADGARLVTTTLDRGRHTLRAVLDPSDESLPDSSATREDVRVHAPNAYVYEDGHGDLSIASPEEGIKIQLKVDELKYDPGRVGVVRELDDTILHVSDAAKEQVPAAGFDLVGAPGSDVWQLPLEQAPDIPWLGVSSERFADEAYRRYTAVRLDGVSRLDGGPAPGAAVVWAPSSARGRS